MGTVRLGHLILNDRWPGTPSDLPVPINGWDNTLDNFKTTASTDLPRYPLGTKIRAYTDNTNCPGWYTMMYLQLHDYSAADISADFSDGKFWCSHICSSHAMNADTSISPYYVVAACYTATDVTKSQLIAVPCASMEADSSVSSSTGYDAATNGYGDAYGWFWVGGVCPCKDVTIMDDAAGSTKGADVTTSTTLRRGFAILEITGGTGILDSPDFTTVNGSDPSAGLGWLTPCGWVCASAA